MILLDVWASYFDSEANIASAWAYVEHWSTIFWSNLKKFAVLKWNLNKWNTNEIEMTTVSCANILYILNILVF